MSALLDLIDQRCVAATRRIAFLGVLGMLIIAGLTVIDVLLRWLWGASILGFNEILGMGLAVAIGTTFPAGAAGRVNLRIDFFASRVGQRAGLWLRATGSFFLLIFYALLTRTIAILALSMLERDVKTTFLLMPQGPFVAAVAFFLLLAVLTQLVVCLVDLRNAMAGADPGIRGAAGGSAGPTVEVANRRLVLAIVAALVLTVLSVWGANWLILAIEDSANSAPGITGIVLFLAMWLVVLLVFPLGAAMGLIGLFGTALLIGEGPSFSVLATESTTFLTNPNVAALPLFLIMGSFAVAAGLSTDIYNLMQTLVSHWRGGLAMATIGGCAGFGALTGSSLATTATIGRVALPEMNQRGYSLSLATGCVAAGGTLGSLVPPSIPLIFYAFLADQSIGQLFIAAVGPAVLAVVLYFLTINVVMRLSPAAAPRDPGRADLREIGRAFARSWQVLLLFGIVIGGLYGGVFTATEAAAVGAGTAFIAALARGKLRGGAFTRVMGETTATTAMIYIIIFGALTFSFFMSVTGAPELLTLFFDNVNLQPIVIIFALLLVYIALGTVMDPFPVMFITVPIVAPLVQGIGYDLVWWGVMMTCVIETGLITPPFGINVFVLKSIAGDDVPLGTIFKGVLPFVGADIVKLVLLVLFPAIALWLPSTMMH